MQTFSVRRFLPAPARTSHKNPNVQRTHLHTICFFTEMLNFFFNFIILLQKNESVRTCGAHLHLNFWKFLHTVSHKNGRTCGRTRARTHTKGLLKCKFLEFYMIFNSLFWRESFPLIKNSCKERKKKKSYYDSFKSIMLKRLPQVKLTTLQFFGHVYYRKWDYP